MLKNYDIIVAIPKTADLKRARGHILYAWSRILIFKKIFNTALILSHLRRNIDFLQNTLT